MGQLGCSPKHQIIKILYQFGSGPLELFNEGSKFKLMNLEEFNKLDYK